MHKMMKIGSAVFPNSELTHDDHDHDDHDDGRQVTTIALLKNFS
mgnify:FL=1